MSEPAGWALEVRVPPERQEALAAWLAARTGAAVEERPDGSVIGFTRLEEDAEYIAHEVLERFETATVEQHAIVHVDWSTRWRDGLGPRQIGRLTLVPSWVPYDPGPHEVVVVLDPETAFGSGEHGSTRAALALLERHLQPGQLLLDLGAGSGILAIAAARLGGRGIAVEIDADAIPVAQRNIDRNTVGDRVKLLHHDAAIVAPLLGPADLACSNILRIINQGLLPEIHMALKPGGKAIFSGMEPGERDLFLPALTQAGFIPEDEVIDDGWWAVLARRP